MGPWCYVNKPGAAEEVKIYRKKLKILLTTHKTKHVFSGSVVKISIQFKSAYILYKFNRFIGSLSFERVNVFKVPES